VEDALCVLSHLLAQGSAFTAGTSGRVAGVAGAELPAAGALQSISRWAGGGWLGDRYRQVGAGLGSM
jgi:hypothetical protein